MPGTNTIANDLFYKVRSRFNGLKLGDELGQVTIDPENARFFDFNYVENNVPIGHVTISLAEPNSMKVYFSTGITEDLNPKEKKRWYDFLKELRTFAKRRLMSFDTRDISKDNLDKRDYQFLSTTGKNKIQSKEFGDNVMSESQLYGNKKISYQKLLDTRLIIKHNQTLQDDLSPGARSRNISALFVENQDGERFKYPFIHLAGARAMQRHVANGGLPYDDVGKSIVQMSEEIAQLKNFSNYVVRNDLMNSDTNNIVERSRQALDSLREQVKKLSKQKNYEQYINTFSSSSDIEIPEDVSNDYQEKFTIKNFKEDIKSVFPIIYRIMQEDSLVEYEDIVEDSTEIENDEAAVITNNELESFEDWVLNLGEQSPLQSDDEQQQAIDSLNELVKENLPAGPDGINAIQSLRDIINDPELSKQIKELAKNDADADVRPLIKSWVEENAKEIAASIDFGDMVDEPAAAQGGDTTAPEEEPQMSADNPEERNKKNAKDDLPFDADDDVSDKDEFGNTIKHRAKHLAKKGMRQAMDVKELAEFITSFYDRNTGTFPKGPEGVCTMVGKKFGEEAEQVARKFVERMAPQQEQGAEALAELGRMRELSGLKTEGDIDAKDVPQFKDYGPGPNPELEDKLTKILKSFEDSALERYHYGDVSKELIQKVAALIEQGETDDAVQAVSDVFGDKDGDAPDRIDDLFEYLRDEFEALADMFGESVSTESSVSEDSEGVFHVDTKKEDMIDVKVVDYHFDSYAEDIIIELENAETGEPVEITDITSGRAEIENWVQARMQKEKDDRDYSEDSGEELDRIRSLSGIAQGIGY